MIDMVRKSHLNQRVNNIVIIKEVMNLIYSTFSQVLTMASEMVKEDNRIGMVITEDKICKL
jgi:hypothetical protein